MAKSTKRQNTLRKDNVSQKYNGFLSQIRLGESYTSLILGAVVVVIAALLLVMLLRSNNQKQETGSANTDESQKEVRTYTVREGEDLWHIAEGLYGSGYNWVELAKANNLSNPNLLETGTKLIIPSIVAKENTVQIAPDASNKITISSYKVIEGDTLWDIAVRSYGDGYKWTQIANANNLQNPDIIFVGSTLNLPR